MRISRLITASAVALFAFAAQRSLGCPTYTLNSTATANWTNTSIWTPNTSYPGASCNDDVTTAPAAAGSVITIDSVIPQGLNTLTWNCPSCVIQIVAGGQLTINTSGVVDNGAQIVVDGGTLVVNAPMPVGLVFQAGTSLQLKNGTIKGSGTLYFEPGSTFNWDTANSPTLDGIEVWNEGLVNFAPPSSASIAFANGVQFFNEPSGTINLDGALDTIASTGTNGIKNRGQLQMNGSSFVHLEPQLDNVNGGTGVIVNDGFLAIEGGGNGDAPFTINAGYLEFPTNTYTMTPNGVVSGAGTLKVNGGTLSIGGVTEPANFTMTAGTLTGDGFLTVTGNFLWSGGTIEGFGGAQIAGTGHGNLDGAVGPMLLRQRQFDVYGTADLSATTNTLQLADGALLGVYGSFNLFDDAPITCNCANPPKIIVSPNGTFAKANGTGISLVSAPLDNNSTISVNEGTLQLAGGGTHNGIFFGGGETQIVFSTKPNTVSGWILFDGTVTFPSSTATITGNYNVGTTEVTGGSVEITSTGETTTHFLLTAGDLDVFDFKMSGNGTWSGGTIEGTAFKVADTATLTVDAASTNVYLADATLTNDGTIDYTAAVPGNHLELSSGIIVNDGTGVFDLQTDAPITIFATLIGYLQNNPHPTTLTVPPNSFNNAGTLQKSGGSGTTEFDPDLHNDGTIALQSGIFSPNNVFDQAAGTISLEGGDVEATLLTMNGGTLEGDGTFDGSVQNDAGTIAPGTPSSIGAIAITSDYSQGPGGEMKIKLGGPAAGQFDMVTASGTSQLDGTFTATLFNGYEPTNGTTFDVHTYGTRTGSFATENLPTWQPPHGSMVSSYPPNAYRLTAIVTPSSADLSLAKSGTASANAGGPLSYSISVTNHGPDSATGPITVVDTLPPGVTGASGSGAPWTCGGVIAGTITCTAPGPILPSGTLGGLTINMNAPANGGSITNSASVSSATADANSANNTGTATTTITSLANLSIVKNGPAGVTSGQNVVYTITVTNNGPSTATSVIVSDPTPANLSFVSSTGACASFPCPLAAMTAGQVAVSTVTYSTSPSFTGNVTNTATVSSTTSDPANGDNTSSATTNVGAQADLSTSKSGPLNASPGQNVTYTVIVTNTGPSPATSVVIGDPTPVGIAFQSNTGACATAYPCLIGTLNAGQSATISSTYTIPTNYSGATVVNTATASSAVNDPDSTNDSAAATTTIDAQADLAISKTGPASVAPGQLIQYTIDITNLGPSTATSIVVSDPTPAGLLFVSNSGACAGAFPCSIAPLASGQSTSITSTYNVPPAYSSGSITNTASVSSAAVADPSSANNSSSVTTPVVAQADVSIVKSGPAFFDGDQDVVYTLTVTNNGPLIANNVFVTDPAPAGTTFVSNSGACTGAFPCSLGTMTVGQIATITTTFHVDASFPGTSLTNTASVSSSTLDVNGANNSSTTITPRVSGAIADLAIVKSGPQFVAPGDMVDFTITVTNNGPLTATTVVVNDPTPSGLTFLSSSGACPSYPCMLASLAPNQSVVMFPRYVVQATSGSITNTATVSSAAADPQPSNNSGSATIDVFADAACPTAPPQLLTPIDHATVGSPVTLSWSAVAHATHYLVIVGATQTNTTNTSIALPLAPGDYAWTVTAFGDSACPQQVSASSSFTVCGNAISTPVASGVAETTTGQTYAITWKPVNGAAHYELQESPDASFAIVETTQLTDTSKAFTKSVAGPTPFFYRVRAISQCGATSSYSHTVRVAVVLVPPPTSTSHNVNVPNGSTTPVTFQVFVPGLPQGSTTFIATVDKPWLSVTPTSGIITPAGLNLTIVADPSALENGTWMGTVLVVYGSVSVARHIATNDATVPPPYTVPVSLSLVTPVTPTDPTTPSPSALIIPAVGHLAGLDSNWRSDIRIANTAGNAQNYRLMFNAGGGTEGALFQSTIIGVDGGNTTALDDIVRNWYGEGSLGESSNGALIIEPLESNDIVSVVPSTTTAVSSRTFNASSFGTLGQFIPAIPFRRFIAGTGGASLLSLQQLAQNNAYRTNLGVLEAAGKPANVLVRVLDDLGVQLLDVNFALRAGEQRQLNGFLRQNGIELANGRVEVSVTGGDGKVTAYASVVDNATQDPFLVFGVPVADEGANRFVVPGVAELAGNGANWRSDVRIFNSGLVPQLATLTFFPAGDPAHSTTREATIAPGEVRALDNVLLSTFDLANAGGALHVSTETNAPLIVTARTYDDGPDGTVGQFVPAVTPQEAVGAGERSLEVLQVEESSRFRTNFGVAEVTGKPVVIEISVHLPDSKATPVVQVELQGNEFRQFPILSSLGLGALYNTRVSMRVISGEGRVTAYGSVIDSLTGDPTFIPAQ